MKLAQFTVNPVYHGFAHIVAVLHSDGIGIERAVLVEHVGDNSWRVVSWWWW